MQKSQGFTLIELLIVVSIMGIIVTFALLSFGDFGEDGKTKRAGELFVSYAQLVKQYAMITDKTLSICIDNNSYSTKVLNQNSWDLITLSPLKKHTLPKNIQIWENSGQIIINQSGEILPFKFFLGNKKNPRLLQISALDNQIKLTEKNESK